MKWKQRFSSMKLHVTTCHWLESTVTAATLKRYRNTCCEVRVSYEFRSNFRLVQETGASFLTNEMQN